MHSHTQDALEYLLCVGRAGGSVQTPFRSSCLLCSVFKGLPSPYTLPGTLGFCDPSTAAGLQPPWGSLEPPPGIPWRHLGLLRGTFATPEAPTLSPRSPNMIPLGSFGPLLRPTWLLGDQFCAIWQVPKPKKVYFSQPNFKKISKDRSASRDLSF